MLVIDGNIEAVYIFRRLCLFIEKDSEAISCIASFYNKNVITKEEFVKGFNLSLMLVVNESNSYKYVTIEDISENTILINSLCENMYPIAISPMAYFFYNFAYNPFKSEKCLIIN